MLKGPNLRLLILFLTLGLFTLGQQAPEGYRTKGCGFQGCIDYYLEKLSGGGTSSGLMSFLEVLDKGAGATKSGGTTRRAAKMVVLDPRANAPPENMLNMSNMVPRC